MPLSRLKAQATLAATRKFTDRETPVEAFETALHAYLIGDVDLRILTYYGVGGIGKSRLLRVLEDLIDGFDAVPAAQVAKVQLDSPRIATPADGLFELRSQLDIDCTVFDFALARHWAYEGLSLDDIRRRGIKPDSLLFDLVEAASGLSGIFVPTGLLKRLWARAEESFVRKAGRHREDLSRLSDMQDAEVTEYLPVFLGSAMADAFDLSGQRFVVFADGHETMLRRFVSHAPRSPADAWLSELAGSAETGLYVIGSREYVGWADQNPDWAPFMEQHMLGRLSEMDAEAFLSTIPIDDANIRKSIVDTADGVPLYLDMCASMFLIRSDEGLEMSDADFRITEEQLVDRFLGHLDKVQSEALKVAALVAAFDEDLFAALMGGMNIGFPMTLFTDFRASSYTTEVDSAQSFFKIHDVVRSHIRRTIDVGVGARVAAIALEYLESTLQVIQPERAEVLFGIACELFRDWLRSPAMSDAERFGMVGMWLIDQGRWNGVSRALSAFDDESRSEPRVRIVLDLLSGRCERKRGALEGADRLLSRSAADSSDLGALRHRYRFHHAHVRHLMGRYTEALDEYESLIRDAPDDREGLRAKALAARQRADVLFLKGRFTDALAAFDGIYAPSADPLWQSDLLRFKGHIHRFNFLLVDAELLYDEALKTANSAQSAAMRGKVLTNLGETLCWTAPSRAHPLIIEALELNEEVDAQIEVGKAQAAMAIARAMVGDVGAAIDAAETALQVQRATGYRAGQLFAWLAQGLVLVAAGDPGQAREVLEEGEALAAELDVYGFVLVPLRAALGYEIMPFESDFDWIDYDRTVEAVGVAVRPIRAQARDRRGSERPHQYLPSSPEDNGRRQN